MEKILPGQKGLYFRPNKGIFEEEAWKAGAYLCGIDEVGRGCLAGPVVAVAALLPAQTDHPLLVDSKILSETNRLTAYAWLQQHALWGTGIISADLIDTLNIYKATQKAMKRAFYGLLSQLSPRHSLHAVAIDAMPLSFTGYAHLPVHAHPKGESWSPSIAAASIIAKVLRDQMMTQAAKDFPAYVFDAHKGYGTPIHQHGLALQGPSLFHRATFLKEQSTSSTDQSAQTTLF